MHGSLTRSHEGLDHPMQPKLHEAMIAHDLSRSMSKVRFHVDLLADSRHRRLSTYATSVHRNSEYRRAWVRFTD